MHRYGKMKNGDADVGLSGAFVTKKIIHMGNGCANEYKHKQGISVMDMHA